MEDKEKLEEMAWLGLSPAEYEEMIDELKARGKHRRGRFLSEKQGTISDKITSQSPAAPPSAD